VGGPGPFAFEVATEVLNGPGECFGERFLLHPSTVPAEGPGSWHRHVRPSSPLTDGLVNLVVLPHEQPLPDREKNPKPYRARAALDEQDRSHDQKGPICCPITNLAGCALDFVVTSAPLLKRWKDGPPYRP
jgi:hypothetical protein